MQGHRDQRRAAEQHVDADQQSERPRGGARQPEQNDGGQDEVDDAARQHPAPSPRQLLLMLERVHDREHAFDDEEHDQQQRERYGAADRPYQQHDAGGDGQHRGEQRPPESRRVPRPERGDQPHDAADEEQPAEEQRERDGGERRDYDRQYAQHNQDDSFDQEQNPMLAYGLRKRALQLIDLARIRRHVRPPSLLRLRRKFQHERASQYNGSPARAASVPIPKFASSCSTVVCELRNPGTLATY